MEAMDNQVLSQVAAQSAASASRSADRHLPMDGGQENEVGAEAPRIASPLPLAVLQTEAAQHVDPLGSQDCFAKAEPQTTTTSNTMQQRPTQVPAVGVAEHPLETQAAPFSVAHRWNDHPAGAWESPAASENSAGRGRGRKNSGEAWLSDRTKWLEDPSPRARDAAHAGTVRRGREFGGMPEDPIAERQTSRGLLSPDRPPLTPVKTGCRATNVTEDQRAQQSG